MGLLKTSWLDCASSGQRRHQKMSIPLSETIVIAVARLVDDSMVPYYAVPIEITEDAATLVKLAKRAVDVAAASKKSARKPSKKKR